MLGIKIITNRQSANSNSSDNSNSISNSSSNICDCCCCMLLLKFSSFQLNIDSCQRGNMQKLNENSDKQRTVAQKQQQQQ